MGGWFNTREREGRKERGGNVSKTRVGGKNIRNKDCWADTGKANKNEWAGPSSELSKKIVGTANTWEEKSN